MDQETAIQLAMEGHNIFLTGNAGTGKTYTLNRIIKNFQKQNKIVAKTASTGIASTLLNGSTVHSWSGIGVKKKLIIDDLYKLKNNPFSRERIQGTDVLIIDEISMLDIAHFDMVEEVCRFVRSNQKPFGGLQVIVCGDFFQLPTVNKGTITKLYCFKAPAWPRTNFKICYLQKIYRQSEEIFINLLNSIRAGTITDKHRCLLHELRKNTDNISVAISLFPTNNAVDIINSVELNQIQAAPRFFKMVAEGKKFGIDALTKNCLAPATLILKKGAHVMFLINKFNEDGTADFVNGTMGEVIDFRDTVMYDKEDKKKENPIEVEGMPVIKIFKTGEEFTVTPYKWDWEEFDIKLQKNVITASIIQIPLKLS